MAQNFTSVRRRELQQTDALGEITNPRRLAVHVAREHMDDLLVEADAGQQELASRVVGVVAVEQVVTPTFDWHAVTGVDHVDAARYCHRTNSWY